MIPMPHGQIMPCRTEAPTAQVRKLAYPLRCHACALGQHRQLQQPQWTSGEPREFSFKGIVTVILVASLLLPEHHGNLQSSQHITRLIKPVLELLRFL